MKTRKARKSKPLKFKVGDFFEDCNHRPCLTIKVEKDDIYGISLVDGTERCCSILHCGVRKLSVKTAIRQKYYGPKLSAKQLAWMEDEVKKEPVRFKHWLWWRDEPISKKSMVFK